MSSEGDQPARTDREIPQPGTIQAEQRRRSFGAWATEYDRYRPGYPAQLYDYLIDMLDPAPRRKAPRVVDIGAGTGQLSVGFIAHGCSVTAVEPDDRMREILAAKPGLVRALAGTAEDIPLPDASADLIVGAQMWHWVDQDKAAAEIARVLKPGGVVAIIWNLRDDRIPWVSALSSVVDMPDSYKWCETHGSPRLTAPLGELTAYEFDYRQPATVDSLVGLIGTFSHVALNPEVQQIKADVRELAVTHPDLRDKDQFTVPYVCRVFTAVRARNTI